MQERGSKGLDQYTERMPGRNDPCPCGSGLKFKKCCGAVIAIESAQRACGTCTACCDGWVAGVIEGHEMKPGRPCYFRGEGCCTIYERRPEVCRALDRGSPACEAEIVRKGRRLVLVPA